MIRARRPLVALVIGLLLQSCTRQPGALTGLFAPVARPGLAEAAVALQIGRQARMLSVSYRLRTAGIALCGGDIAPILGAAFWSVDPLYSRAFREELERRFGLRGDSIGVVALLPDSPAARAGVRVGDQIVAVDGARVWTAVDVVDRVRASDRPAIGLALERDDRPVDVAIERVPACHHEAFFEIGDLMLSDRVAGGNFYVTSGFVRFAQTDDELALVVAHEIGHQLADARDVSRGPEAETRADQIGLYLAAIAGFDVAIAPAFWDRVALEQPWSLSDDVEYDGWSRVPPHGFMPWRAAAIRRVTGSIAAKRQRGQPLLPDPE